MQYYSVKCEAPGGLGPNAIYKYDSKRSYIQEIEYLDLEFEVWLGGELVEHVDCYCVSARLWKYLSEHGIRGVSVRDMAVTAGPHVNDAYPNRVIPLFKELMLPRTLEGQRAAHWVLNSKSIPDADMFTGLGLPLFITERVRNLLVAYGSSGAEFDRVSVSGG